MERAKKQRILFFILGYLLLVFVYNLYFERFAIQQAEHRIEQMLLSTRAYTKFISKEQKPLIYELKEQGILKDDYFHPALLSTNYITRVATEYYNKELKSQSLHEIIFRQASTNPLNPQNKADKFEEKLIKQFNTNEISKYTKLQTIEGEKHLYLAIPFKRVTPQCMKCHDSPENSPSDLVQRYGTQSGYGYKLGEINAATSATTSITGEVEEARHYLFLLSIITFFLFFIAYLFIEKMLKHIQHTQLVKAYSQELEQEVQERTSELEKSLDVVQQAQGRLIESEKMASLGRLVAGVAHEINTPVGVSVTAASHLQHKCETFFKLYEDKKVSQNDFDTFLDVNKTSTKIILSNLERAAELINSFKRISVDQTSETIRDINLKEYLDAIILSLHPKLKKTNHRVHLECDEHINITLAAGSLSQVISNLIDNSLQHAFENIENGLMQLNVKNFDNRVELIYTDNGKGLQQEEKEQFFEPFYTTKRSSGGSGLGTHIIYNLVTQSLHGTIDLKSEPGEGLEIYISIPIQETKHV